MTGGIVLRFGCKQRPARPEPPPRPEWPCRWAGGCSKPAVSVGLCAEHTAAMSAAVKLGQAQRERRRTAVSALRQLGASRAAIARRLGVSPSTVLLIELRLAREAERQERPEPAPWRARPQDRMLLAAARGILAVFPLDPEP